MILARDLDTLRSKIDEWKRQQLAVGLVPTMGFFHDGHLALMEEAKRHCRKCVVSIFVNPRQFGPDEDLDRYPRDFERDVQLGRETGVDLLFAPSAEQIYPDGYQTTVSLSVLPRGLCGTSRPGHFDGVATVVAKLFNLVKPDVAVFGQKDYQQLMIIRQMAEDLNFNVDIIGHPIVREEDGLAMSSRNKHLSPESRKNAVCLYSSLVHAQRRVHRHGSVPAVELVGDIKQRIAAVKQSRVDYVSVVDARTLMPKTVAEKGDLLALAVYFEDKVRLIDNMIM